MIKLTTYINQDAFLNFTFKDCKIDYYKQTKWVNIRSEKQKITIKNSFIAADEEIGQQGVDVDSLTTMWIQDLYKHGHKMLIISAMNDEPIKIFWGEEISIKYIEDDFYQFVIDDKPIWTYQMKFLILTKNVAPV